MHCIGLSPLRIVAIAFSICFDLLSTEWFDSLEHVASLPIIKQIDKNYTKENERKLGYIAMMYELTFGVKPPPSTRHVLVVLESHLDVMKCHSFTQESDRVFQVCSDCDFTFVSAVVKLVCLQL